MSEEINHHRHRFLGTAAMTIAAAQFGPFGSADALPGRATPPGATMIKPGTHTSFGPFKQIDAGLLNPPKAEREWWYQYYFATERGRAGYEKYRNDFAKLIWQLASPKWNFSDLTFNRSAASFDNPDHVSIGSDWLKASHSHRIIKGGIGHNLPQEAPQAFAEAVVDVDGY
jgi:hypothetical protein